MKWPWAQPVSPHNSKVRGALSNRRPHHLNQTFLKRLLKFPARTGAREVVRDDLLARSFVFMDEAARLIDAYTKYATGPFSGLLPASERARVKGAFLRRIERERQTAVRGLDAPLVAALTEMLPPKWVEVGIDLASKQAVAHFALGRVGTEAVPAKFVHRALYLSRGWRPRIAPALVVSRSSKYAREFA